MSDEIEIDHLRRWIGKRDRESDIITPELLKRFRATLAGFTELGPQLPLGIHWCLAQPAVAHDALGTDGHPSKGGFLPPVPLPRRMWASSRIRFRNALSIDMPLERTSTIADVVLKQSAASGPLVFVTVDHEYGQSGVTLIEDRQTIVYRQAAPYKRVKAEKPENILRSMHVIPDSRLLFRYSALTFNSHRIHYDHDYATNEEGYPGLVVHGPLTATLLMNLAQASRPEDRLREFEFRAMAPTFAGQTLHLSVQDKKANSLAAKNLEGGLIMTASAEFGA